jgi:hypothetical protein
MRQQRSKIKMKGSDAFAFVVDGDTEVWYLQMFKRNERELNINIEPKLPSKKSIPEQFKMVQYLATDYKKVFWIVDYDIIAKETREAKKGVETRKYFTKQENDIYLKLKHKLRDATVNSKNLKFDKYNTSKAICEMNSLFGIEEIQKVTDKK